MQRIRLASVAYLNALPLTRGLTHGDDRGAYDLLMAPPCECARLLQEGWVDVALIPSIEFARTAGLVPVPGTGVSSRHEVRSVLLLSRSEPARIRSLAVDLNSRTSVALTRLILARRFGCRPRIESAPPEPERMLEEHDAALVIGDAALRTSLRLSREDPAFHGVRVLDLAREWHAMTRLPFVFAFWACRPVMPVSGMADVFRRSLEKGLAALGAIADEEAGRTSLPAPLIESYLRENIHYRLGPPETDSIRLFFRMCREEGILPGQARDALSSTSSVTLNKG
ncbi:MAG TPA: menaquinone biosynthesis protein [Candidatus Polarisedimenticolia bacterium]|nr:menaquinone biosynthesis protein [Candidatus Polarisedimenticolia bacterium]